MTPFPRTWAAPPAPKGWARPSPTQSPRHDDHRRTQAATSCTRCGRLRCGTHLGGIEDDVEFDEPEGICDTIVACQVLVVDLLDRTDQALLHAEHGVVVQEGAAFDEQVGDHGAESFCAADEVDVGGPVRVTISGVQHAADTNVVWDPGV